MFFVMKPSTECFLSSFGVFNSAVFGSALELGTKSFQNT